MFYIFLWLQPYRKLLPKLGFKLSFSLCFYSVQPPHFHTPLGLFVWLFSFSFFLFCFFVLCTFNWQIILDWRSCAETQVLSREIQLTLHMECPVARLLVPRVLYNCWELSNCCREGTDVFSLFSAGNGWQFPFNSPLDDP